MRMLGTPPLFSSLLWLAVIAHGLVLTAQGRGQQADDQPLKLKSVVVGPVRGTLTDRWTTLEAYIMNPNPTARDARLMVFYADRPDAQYGRDIWIPANSTVTTWVPIGPRQQHGGPAQYELQCVLSDRRGGKQRVLLPAEEMGKIRSQPVTVRPHEWTTSLLIDDDDEAPAWLARLFRQSAGLSEVFGGAAQGPLPAQPESLASIDQIILAGHNLAHDPAGRQTLRSWLLQGGSLWIMLDRADPDVVADLLGDGLGPRTFDRTSLTTVAIRNHQGRLVSKQVQEQPVDLVRVFPGPDDTVLQTVDGWPASFIRHVGHGTVVFTTLGARGWYRPRLPSEAASPWPDFPDLPVALPALDELTRNVMPSDQAHPFRVEAFAPLLQADIGYSLVGPGPVAAIFGGFLLVVLLAGAWLRRSQRTELIGWLGPAAAVLAGAAFFVMGERTRRDIPPTVASVAMIDAATDNHEQSVQGLLAVYHPSPAEPAVVAAEHGGTLDLDEGGLVGKIRRRIVTDVNAWHMENLDLPAGVRLGSYRTILRLTEPPSAVGQLTGNKTVEGKVAVGSLSGFEDAVLSTPSGQPLAVRLEADGHFAAGASPLLPNQYLVGAVLTDQQQQRQGVYRQLLGDAMPPHLQGRSALLVWTNTAEVPFTFDANPRIRGSTLFILPVTLARPAPGTAVTIPSAFLRCQRVFEDRGVTKLNGQGNQAVDMHLRFVLPPELLPFKVQKVELSTTARAVARRLTISGLAPGRRVPLKEVNEPNGDIRLTITDPDLLRLDSDGALHLSLAISDLFHPLPRVNGMASKDETWTLNDMQLEITGQTTP